jgi:hypothetical protein
LFVVTGINRSKGAFQNIVRQRPSGRNARIGMKGIQLIAASVTCVRCRLGDPFARIRPAAVRRFRRLIPRYLHGGRIFRWILSNVVEP